MTHGNGTAAQYTWDVRGRFLTHVKTNTVFLYGNQPDWRDRARLLYTCIGVGALVCVCVCGIWYRIRDDWCTICRTGQGINMLTKGIFFYIFLFFFFFYLVPTKGSRSRGSDRPARRGPGDKSNPIKGSLVRKLFRGVCSVPAEIVWTKKNTSFSP